MTFLFRAVVQRLPGVGVGEAHPGAACDPQPSHPAVPAPEVLEANGKRKGKKIQKRPSGKETARGEAETLGKRKSVRIHATEAEAKISGNPPHLSRLSPSEASTAPFCGGGKPRRGGGGAVSLRPPAGRCYRREEPEAGPGGAGALPPPRGAR